MGGDGESKLCPCGSYTGCRCRVSIQNPPHFSDLGAFRAGPPPVVAPVQDDEQWRESSRKPDGILNVHASKEVGDKSDVPERACDEGEPSGVDRFNDSYYNREALEIEDRYTSLLDQLLEIHQRKAADYGTEYDPMYNLRAAAEFGISPVTGVLIRMYDKMHRLMRWAAGHEMKNESARDSLIDISNYALLAIMLMDEEL